MNKILLVGSDQVWSLERVYLRHLLQLGSQAELFGAQNIFYDYYGKSIFNKLLFKAGFSNIHQQINQQLLEKVKQFRPGLIWVFKGMEILPNTLKSLKQTGYKLINYNPDNPFIFSGAGSGNSNVIDALGIYDAHFTYDTTVQQKITQEYKIPCGILPFGFELSDELYNRCSAQEEVLRVCFLGNPDKHRAHFLEQLAGDIKIDVYGHGWEQFIKHPSITIHAPAYGDDFWLTLRRYRVQLNLMRPHNPSSHNMRSFEVPGVGGIGLFPDTGDHRSFFENGKEVFLYKEVDDCRKLAHSLLKMNSEEANAIRKSARQKSLVSRYSYHERTVQLLADLEKLGI